VTSRPDLAVVDAETFERAHARFRGGRPRGRHPARPGPELTDLAVPLRRLRVALRRRRPPHHRFDPTPPSSADYHRGEKLYTNSQTVVAEALAAALVRGFFQGLTPEVLRACGRHLSGQLSKPGAEHAKAVAKPRAVIRRLVHAVASLEGVDTTDLVARLKTEKAKLAAPEAGGAGAFPDAHRNLLVNGDALADASLVKACEAAVAQLAANLKPADPIGLRDAVQASSPASCSARVLGSRSTSPDGT
jgi:hypothetical protein